MDQGRIVPLDFDLPRLVAQRAAGDVKLYHFDLYRLSDPEEFYAAGLDEFVGGDGVALIEWPEMAELDPEGAIHVRIERSAMGDEAREIEIDGEYELLTQWRRDQ